MTSSLVGSEMCIRDRVKVCGCTGSMGWLFHNARSRRSGTGSSGVSPVSYTHLTLPTICSV
eukprot:9213857-Prorocentrum_lima.AAC.1